MLANDISKLMEQIPLEDAAKPSNSTMVKGGVFSGVQDNSTPFGFKKFEGLEAGRGESEWIVAKDKYKYDEIFEKIVNADGKVSGAAAKSEMVKSKLPNTVLAKVTYKPKKFLALKKSCAILSFLKPTVFFLRFGN